jgi:hypothetical protein
MDGKRSKLLEVRTPASTIRRYFRWKCARGCNIFPSGFTFRLAEKEVRMSTVADKVKKPEKSSSKGMDIEGLTEMPVHHLRKFMQFIAEHNLWDEVEQHLRTNGCTKLMISYEPMGAVGKLLAQKKASGAVKQKLQILPHCGCNGPVGPRPGPVTPPSHGGGGDGGAPSGGGGPDGGGGSGPDGGGGGGPDGGGGGGGDPIE